MKRLYIFGLLLISPFALGVFALSVFVFFHVVGSPDPGEGGFLIAAIFPLVITLLVFKLLIRILKRGIQQVL